jgi:opacity protein-like surface antigen
MTKQMVIAAGLVLIPALAAAQPTTGGFGKAFGGITFGTETAGVFGGAIGASITPGVEVFGEVGYMQNVLPDELQENIDDAVGILSIVLRVPVTVDAKVPALYGLGGVRGNLATGTAVTPFLDGGGGLARITLDVDAEAAGIDISEELEDELDLESETKFLVVLGGGVNLRITDGTGIDLGYRYVRIFTDDPAVNVSHVYAGVRVGF